MRHFMLSSAYKIFVCDVFTVSNFLFLQAF